jgi:hypothetical protein
MKYPAIVGTLGKIDMERAIQVIIPLPIAANMKLENGVNIRLAMTIGIVNTNNERPFTTSSGVSLKVSTIVNRSRNKKDALFPGRLLI